MNPPPMALGLTLSEKLIVEERTRNTSYVSTFTKLLADQFPTAHERFAGAAGRTTHGTGRIPGCPGNPNPQTTNLRLQVTPPIIDRGRQAGENNKRIASHSRRVRCSKGAILGGFMPGELDDFEQVLAS